MGSNFKTTKNGTLVSLGSRIRALRNSQGLSQAQLADSAGMSPRYLSEIEAGKRNVSFKRLEALAQILSVTLPELLNIDKPGAKEEIINQIQATLAEMPVDKLLFVHRALRMYQND